MSIMAPQLEHVAGTTRGEPITQESAEMAAVEGLLQAIDRDCQEPIVGAGELEALEEGALARGEGRRKSVRNERGKHVMHRIIVFPSSELQWTLRDSFKIGNSCKIRNSHTLSNTPFLPTSRFWFENMNINLDISLFDPF